MWTEYLSTFGHVTAMTLGLIRRRPTRVAIFLSIIALLVLAVAFSVTYVQSNFMGAFGPSVVYANNNGSTSLEGVALLATVWSLDTNLRTMSVSWSIMGGCGVNYTFEKNTSCVQNGFSIPMNLYLNLAPSSDWNITAPAGSYDPTTMSNPQPAHYIPGRQSIPTTSFDTVLPIEPFMPYTQDKKTTTLFYPFDVFTSYVSLVAINPTDNSTIPIVFAGSFGTIVNWEGGGDFHHPNSSEGEPQYSLSLVLQRQPQVKALAILLLLVGWAMSLAVLWMSIIVLFGHHVPADLLLTSTTILFALPQIRASMPDAPPFGAFIDIGGYFMNVLLVSLCTSFLLATQLRHRYQPGNFSIKQSMEYGLIGTS